MIRVQTEAFDAHAETAAFSKGRAEAGALASFVGSVRDSAHGDTVSALELEAYPGFTEKQIAKIEDEARARFDVIDTLVIHRYGRMAPGEAIVLVAALSKHRREALQAVDYLMDRLKTEAPFWKREVRPDGAEWIEPRGDDREAHARWNSSQKTVYVRLLDEGVDVWRPALAMLKGERSFVLLDQEVPSGEVWEFNPGDVVELEERQLSEGVVPVCISSRT